MFDRTTIENGDIVSIPEGPIKSLPPLVARHVGARFQFPKDQLKDVIRYLSPTFNNEFQFPKDQLKAIRSASCTGLRTVSIPEGPIKSAGDLILAEITSTFQFPKDQLKVLPQHQSRLSPPRFNSRRTN